MRRELTAAGAGGEVVVAGSLGRAGARSAIRPAASTRSGDRARRAPPGPMTGRIAAMTLGEGLTVLHRARPGRQAFLDDHRIDGTPVLPGVMGMEALRRGRARAAARLARGGRRGRRSAGAVQVLPRRAADARAAGAAARRAATARWWPTARWSGGARCPAAGSRRRVHFTGRVRLDARAPPAPPRRRAPRRRAPSGAASSTRRSTASTSTVPPTRCSSAPGARTARSSGGSPPTCRPTTSRPAQPTEIAPRLIELCFQTAGVWELGTAGRMALPTHVDRVTRFAGADDAGRAVGGRQPARGRRRRRRRGRRRRGPGAGPARGLPHDRAPRAASTPTRSSRSARR